MIYNISSPRFLSCLRCVDACAATSPAGNDRHQLQLQEAWTVLLEVCPDIQRELEPHKSTILAKLGEPKRRSRYSSHPSDDVPKLIRELREKKELRNFVHKDRAFPTDTCFQVYKTREQEKVVRKFRHTKFDVMLQDTYKRPDLVLKRICYRIRWIAELAWSAFDLDMFYSTLTARILLGLLESKMSCRN